MSRMFVLLILLGLAGTVDANRVFKCTDPETGKVTFTDRGCVQGSGESVSVFTGNVVDGQAERDAALQRQVLEQLEAQRPQAILLEDNNSRRGNEMDRACREAATPLKGAQNRQLTASQRQVLAACAGLPVPAQQTSGSYSVPAPASVPAPITSCDPGGCWDTQGGRYTQGAGATYFNPSGVACQRIGNQMQCP